jgi:AraC-like DNA-binding protein
MGIFRKEGCVISLDEETALRLADTVRMIGRESNRFRQRLLLLYYLSCLSECEGEREKNELPGYIKEALSYVKENYGERIVAEELARSVNVGRTTLMTGFRKYVGVTLGEYLLKCRLIAAVELLSAGESERVCAERCGFGEVSSLIRSFKRRFGITPRKYIAVLKAGHITSVRDDQC